MAKGSSRNYTDLTIKRLFALSGNRCAFPDCTIQFLNQTDDTNFSNICHIEDANKNTHKLDRYNPRMTDKERSDYKNLILLCPNHHIETNNTSLYNVEGLKKMKNDHERKIELLKSSQNSTIKHFSVLSAVVNQVGASQLEKELDDSGKNAPRTEEKILYNNVITYKPIIQEYSVYQGKLNAIYEEIEKQGSNRKDFLLQNIRTLYLREKGKFSDINEIRVNADKIFENIEGEIWGILERSSNLDSNLPIESLKIGVLIVMVDAFMRCKILEEPVK